MAKIVCISNGTYRPGINKIGDIVDIHDDDVTLGKSYDSFEVIYVRNLTAKEVESTLKSKIPNRYYDENRKKDYWVNNGVDYEMKAPPHYPLNIIDLTLAEIVQMKSETTTKTSLRTILKARTIDNISTDPKNTETIKESV